MAAGSLRLEPQNQPVDLPVGLRANGLIMVTLR
jgi:hypothetical protein